VTKYPHEAGEVEEFTPASLRNLPCPPVFLIRPATPRDKRRIDKLVIKEGLSFHSNDLIRDAMLSGLKAQWSDDIYLVQEGRIKAYWDAIDQYAKQYAGAADAPEFKHPDDADMKTLTSRIFKVWPPLCEMAADNAEFNEVWPTLTAAVLLIGWTGIDVPFRREANQVSIDDLSDLGEALADLEREHAGGTIESIGEPGTAMNELCARCASAIYITKGEEKNSVSPSPSPETPATSKTDGLETTDGPSTATPSTKIPAN